MPHRKLYLLIAMILVAITTIVSGVAIYVYADTVAITAVVLVVGVLIEIGIFAVFLNAFR